MIRTLLLPAVCSALFMSCVSAPGTTQEEAVPKEDIQAPAEKASVPQDNPPGPSEAAAEPPATEESPAPPAEAVSEAEQEAPVPPAEAVPDAKEEMPPPPVEIAPAPKEEPPLPPRETVPETKEEIPAPKEELPAPPAEVIPEAKEEPPAPPAETAPGAEEEPPADAEDVGLVIETSRPVIGNFQEYTQVEYLPEIIFKGRGVKVEAEQMLLADCSVEKDFLASGGYSVIFGEDTSCARFTLTLPAGSYECLVSEKAYDTDQSAFYVLLNEEPHRVYPSNPPLGLWELTTRTPIYLTLEEESTLSVAIQPHSTAERGSTGMLVDYIQFVRLDDEED